MFRNRGLSLIKRFFSTNTKYDVRDPVQKAALAEKCIVVNELDVPVRSASKLDCHLIQPDGSLILHRAFSVFLFNTKGEMLLQKRAASKVTFPSYVSNTCCSHPLDDFPSERTQQNGLGVKHAAIRRLHLELGIPKSELRIEDFTYLTRFIYHANADDIWGEHELDYVLILQKDVTLNPNPNEVSEVTFVAKNDLNSYIDTLQDPITPWFRIITKHFLPLWWNNLSNLQEFQDHTNIKKF